MRQPFNQLAPQFQLLTHVNAVRGIHPQELHRRPAHSREADNSHPGESRVFAPKMRAGMNSDTTASDGGSTREVIRAVVPIAVGQAFSLSSWASVLAGRLISSPKLPLRNY